jgi:thiamine-monophosphate kinase
VDGEFELIERLIDRLPPPGPRLRIGPGDDATVTEGDPAAVISVDGLIEGIHFELPPFELEDVARKAVAAALSDLAAMGAEPAELYVIAGLPEHLSVEDGERLFGALADAASGHGAALAGGDVTRAPALLLGITAVGVEPSGAPLVSRAGARAGDAVVLTGELGGAAAGLELLGEARNVELEPPVADALRSRQLDPRPRLEAGRALAGSGARAMIDLSDGLGGDALHLSAASGVALTIEMGSVPLQAGVEEVAGDERRAIELAASGGEDLELLATLPEEKLADATAAVEASGSALTRIGEVQSGSGVTLRLPDGGALQPRGYDHLRSEG